MKIKPFLQLSYMIAGLCISLFTAIMTYIIIDEPIGMKMVSKIALTIFATLPIIGLFSYFIGKHLSKKFELIADRLDEIDESKFQSHNTKENIEDISNIHNSINKLSSRLESSILELQESNQNLNAVIQSLSHDIKTPLTIIDGYLEELEDGLIRSSDIPQTINILKKETAYINELSSEVIEYIHSQEKNTPLKKSIELKDFLLLEVYSLLRTSKDVTLQCQLEEKDSIVFNPISLKKILINLLHNASKYTFDGTITLRVNKENIIVEDTGIGIEAKYAKSIFEPFVLLDESKNREKNGFGLGLSISSHLAKNNGYSLYLDTSYKGGSRFILKKLTT